MKTLLISHNPITTYQSMGKTFLSLFCEFSKDELCQLYVYPSLPDVDMCNSCYRITDKNVFDSYFQFVRVVGREILAEQIDTTKHDFFENQTEENFINAKKSPFKMLCRDMMWKCARWYNNPLKNWIEAEKPTCIFLAPGGAKFIYNIALKIARIHKLPIITYICDEYYFIDNAENAIDKLKLRLLQRKMRQLMKQTSRIVSISDEINRQYSTFFGVQAETIMTGANIEIADSAKRNKEFHGITYLGNLSYDRLSSLLDIGRMLDEINSESNTNIKMYLYTRTLSEDNRKRINEVPSIEYCGYVTGDAFTDVLKNAEALLHVESFSEVYTQRVKNSISTKIADSLASGNPLIAYAPGHIASMKYLISSGAAQTITNKDELKSKLLEFLFDSEKRTMIASLGLETAKANHIAKNNSAKLRELCIEISGVANAIGEIGAGQGKNKDDAS